MNAILPEQHEQIGLKDLLNKEVVYTVPWAMYADSNGELWLNGDYTFGLSSRGTSTMKVTKKDSQYICDISKCKDHKWNCGTPGYVGNFTPLPVSKLLD